jgi:hypothetical protein
MAQIEYQRQQIGAPEDRLRAHATVEARVTTLVDQIATSAQGHADPRTLSFLMSQVEAVKQEYGQAAPNELVVSAALDATIYVCQRLGPDVIHPSLVDALASIAPSGGKWGA